MNNDRKRSSILINKRFQLSIIGWFSLLAVIITGVFYLSVTFFFSEMINEARAAGLPAEHVYFRFVAGQQMTLNKIFFVCTSVAVIFILGGGLWLSHQVAGPLHRLVQYLRDNKSSKDSAPPLKFRKGDYFPELEEAVNEFIRK